MQAGQCACFMLLLTASLAQLFSLTSVTRFAVEMIPYDFETGVQQDFKVAELPFISSRADFMMNSGSSHDSHSCDDAVTII